MAESPDRTRQIAQELQQLQRQLSKLEGPQAKQAAAIFQEVAALAAAISSDPEGDPDAATQKLQQQARRVHSLIDRLGKGPKR